MPGEVLMPKCGLKIQTECIQGTFNLCQTPLFCSLSKGLLTIMGVWIVNCFHLPQQPIKDLETDTGMWEHICSTSTFIIKRMKVKENVHSASLAHFNIVWDMQWENLGDQKLCLFFTIWCIYVYKAFRERVNSDLNNGHSYWRGWMELRPWAQWTQISMWSQKYPTPLTTNILRLHVGRNCSWASIEKGKRCSNPELLRKHLIIFASLKSVHCAVGGYTWQLLQQIQLLRD